jgi:hypothetical protein
MPDNPMTDCPDCKGHGWLLAAIDGDPDDLSIERCDNCRRFDSDNEANQFVAKLAWKERRKTPAKRRALGPYGKAGRLFREYFTPDGGGASMVEDMRRGARTRLAFLDRLTPIAKGVFELLQPSAQGVLHYLAWSDAGLPMKQVAWLYHCDRRVCASILSRLKKAGIVDNCKGHWTVNNEDFRAWARIRLARPGASKA